MAEPRLSDLVDLLARAGQLAAPPEGPGGGLRDRRVGAIRYDSRTVTPGDLFVARRGQHADGHEHIPAAVAAGAVAVVVERRLPSVEVPQVHVRDARVSLALAAAWREGHPSRRLGVVGITGTDGKTTTAYLARAILERAGMATGLIGTTDVIVAGRSMGNPARMSTPEAPELQGYLAAMLAGGDRWAVVESTSHGLAQERVGALAYDIAVLTNVTSEHLELHGTPEAYRAAKRSLFTRLERSELNPEKGWGKQAVVNADDGEAIAVTATAQEAGATVLRYGLAAPLGGTARPGPDLVATSLQETPAGLRVGVRARAWAGEVVLRLAGRFNIGNALAALGVAAALGLDLDAAAAALGRVEAIPGRMERIDEGQPFSVVVDYAHTAEALARVLDEMAPGGAQGGLIAVFGSAGERDTSKRSVMGRVAGERCRLVVVTDEDPRGEDREAILEAIAVGAEAAGKRRGRDLLVIPDRAEAIATAIARARPGDGVLLAGKGHERTIETAAGAQEWDEVGVARQALRSRQGRGGSGDR